MGTMLWLNSQTLQWFKAATDKGCLCSYAYVHLPGKEPRIRRSETHPFLYPLPVLLTSLISLLTFSLNHFLSALQSDRGDCKDETAENLLSCWTWSHAFRLCLQDKVWGKTVWRSGKTRTGKPHSDTSKAHWQWTSSTWKAPQISSLHIYCNIFNNSSRTMFSSVGLSYNIVIVLYITWGGKVPTF